MKKLKIIVSGGGTAGHIYPAIAVAEKLHEHGHDVLFVGAKGKMEMDLVPKAGFRIIGLPIMGLNRSNVFKNIKVVWVMVRAVIKARYILKSFKPDVVVGFGGFASAPILKAAQGKNIRTIIQEQNSYAGVTNRMLAKNAQTICCAYNGMERFFDADKIVLTGNPLRLVHHFDDTMKLHALEHFGLSRGKKTILVTGGSLGTRSLNEAVLREFEGGIKCDVQILLQTGKIYHKEMVERAEKYKNNGVNIKIVDFIDRMDYAYSMSDLIICRAGANTISELELLGKAAIFVPSPNVAEDHQTKNAQSIVDSQGGLMVKDADAIETLFTTAYELVFDEARLKTLSENISKLGKPNAAEDIARIVEGVKNNDKNIYFVGIGGIGMSALARFFKHNGFQVAGYDLTQTPLTEALQNEGIDVIYTDDYSLIDSSYKDANNSGVIYTPAIPKGSKILDGFTKRGLKIMKRSEALGMLSNERNLMAVAGTHGKTTTSSMAAHFMVVTTGEGNAFLGGIAKNFESNVVMGSGKNMVVEADEFDRSFLRLTPNSALITSADPDHLDIYGSPEEFKRGFEQFIDCIKCAGKVVIKEGVDLHIDRNDIAIFSYSLNDSNTDYYATNLNCNKYGHYEFDLVTPSRTIEGCRLGIPGLINVENCIGAVALIDDIVVDKSKFRTAISSYRGVARRFDMWINTSKIVYMDDYAHHPDELRAMLSSAREMFYL